MVALIKPAFRLHTLCTLVDRSHGGERLKVLGILDIPAEILLIIDAETLQACVTHRSLSELGIAFMSGRDTGAELVLRSERR
jgi:hypothetical protein